MWPSSFMPAKLARGWSPEESFAAGSHATFASCANVRLWWLTDIPVVEAKRAAAHDYARFSAQMDRGSGD